MKSLPVIPVHFLVALDKRFNIMDETFSDNVLYFAMLYYISPFFVSIYACMSNVYSIGSRLLEDYKL